MHAGFRDAVVSVLDGGHTLRVTDHGPGIDDRDRALQPGYSTADADDRAVIRGVGGGLPLAAAAMAELGGRLELDDNLGGGAAVTLRHAPRRRAPAGRPGLHRGAPARSSPCCSSSAAPARPGSPRSSAARAPSAAASWPSCEHRGLVRRETGGARALTEAGTRLVATLF